MPQPLVLRQGRVAQELPAEAGVYPKLRIVGGGLVAGGAGLDLYYAGRRLTQVAPVEGGPYVAPGYTVPGYVEGDSAYVAPGYIEGGYVAGTGSEPFVATGYVAEGYVK